MSSLWNTLTGGSSHHKQQPAASSTPAPSSQQQSFTPSSTPTQVSSPFPPQPTTVPPTSFDPFENQGVESFLKPSTFADPSQLHPLAGLNKDTLEYLSLEDASNGQSVIPSRGFTDDLCYGTGIAYLSALSLGGAWGLQEGLRRSEGQPPKLRLNSVLNAVTRRGPFLGNSAGVIAICYNLMNSYFGYLRGYHDAANSVLAGTLSGMLFRSTQGVKPMLIAGGIVGSAAATWTVIRQLLIPSQDQQEEHHL